MNVCANCPATAAYAYCVGGDKRVLFCAEHLPSFLRIEKYRSLVEGTEFFEEKRRAALQKLSALKSPKTETKPASRKRRTTKKTTQNKAPKKDVVDTLDVQPESIKEVTK